MLTSGLMFQAPSSPEREAAPGHNELLPRLGAAPPSPPSAWDPTPNAWMHWYRSHVVARAEQSEPAAKPLPLPTGDAQTTLYPFGDVNGDGLDDFLSVIQTPSELGPIIMKGEDGEAIPERPSTTLELRAGGTFEPLWVVTIHDPWYAEPDLTGDGVADVVVTRPGESEMTQYDYGAGGIGVSTKTVKTPLTFEVLNGATGKEAFEYGAEEVYRATFAYASTPASVYLVAYRFEVDYLLLTSVATNGSGHPVLLKFHDTFTMSYAGAVATSGALYLSQTQVDVVGLSGEGTERWRSSQGSLDTVVRSLLLADASGDGKRDLIFHTVRPQSATYVYGGPAGLGTPPIQEAHVAVMNGATGEALWNHEGGRPFLLGGPFLGDSLLLPIGDVSGDKGADVALLILRASEEDRVGYETQLAYWNGADGRILRDVVFEGSFQAPLLFGDADGDGHNDLLVLIADLEGAPPDPPRWERVRVQVQRADGGKIWERTLREEDLWSMEFVGLEEAFEGRGEGFHDYTGDGAPDLLYFHHRYLLAEPAQDHGEHYSGGGMGLWSGSNGTTVYETEQPPEWGSTWTTIHDVSGEKGWDLVAFRFEGNEPSHCQGASCPVPHATTPSADDCGTSGCPDSHCEDADCPPPHTGPPVLRLTVFNGANLDRAWTRAWSNTDLACSDTPAAALRLFNGGQLDGRGGDELLLSLGGGIVSVMVTPAPMDDEPDWEGERCSTTHDPINRVMVVESLDGRFLWVQPGFAAGHEPSPAIFEEWYEGLYPGNPIEKGSPLPAPALALALLAVGIALWRRRRA